MISTPTTSAHFCLLSLFFVFLYYNRALARLFSFFFFNDPAPTEISPLPLHAPLPIFHERPGQVDRSRRAIQCFLLHEFGGDFVMRDDVPLDYVFEMPGNDDQLVHVETLHRVHRSEEHTSEPSH